MERDRLLKILKKGETLCDAFCGVGPLSIRAAKQGINVLANDLNPDCYKYLVINSEKNKVSKNISCFNMDAREFIRICISRSKVIKNEDDNFDDKFPEDKRIDHIYMNLPKDALEFLDVFYGLFNGTKKSIYDKDNLPTIHVYCFAKESNATEEILSRARETMKYNNFGVNKNDYILHNIRDISPRKYMFCLSFKLPEEVAYGK